MVYLGKDPVTTTWRGLFCHSARYRQQAAAPYALSISRTLLIGQAIAASTIMAMPALPPFAQGSPAVRYT